MGNEDVGEGRDARLDLGGFVFGWGFLGGRVPLELNPSVLENPITVLGSVWTTVDTYRMATYCQLRGSLLEIGQARISRRDILVYLSSSGKTSIVVACYHVHLLHLSLHVRDN